eukprot:2361106-Pyramimonas_sp.AAC.1
MAELLLQYCIAVERRLWPHGCALRQFEGALKPELLMKLEEKNFGLDQLWDMDAQELGHMLRHPAAGKMDSNGRSNVTPFYGASRANNSKGALKTLESL